MLLFALALSFKWNSGHSDSNVIAGFLPYKDGAGYYYGASLILHGLPLENTLQAGWRPLFSGFLSSLPFLLGGNLKIVLAILVFLAGTGTWCAARQVYGSFGPLPASLFITFLYFYIQPNIGLTMTELLGFAMGCFAFSILWLTAMNPRWPDLVIGLIVLVLAVSVRAGTFFILPLMAIWAGRIFRGSRNFSWRALGVALLTILLVYFEANSLYPRWVGVPEGLVEVARILRGCLRESDLVARHGGDEFIAALMQTSHEDALRLAKNIQWAVDSLSFELSPGKLVSIGISIGCATYPEHGDTLEELGCA